MIYKSFAKTMILIRNFHLSVSIWNKCQKVIFYFVQEAGIIWSWRNGVSKSLASCILLWNEKLVGNRQQKQFLKSQNRLRNKLIHK